MGVEPREASCLVFQLFSKWSEIGTPAQFIQCFFYFSRLFLLTMFHICLPSGTSVQVCCVNTEGTESKWAVEDVCMLHVELILRKSAVAADSVDLGSEDLWPQLVAYAES